MLLKSLGNAPKQWLLGNNPFHHTINWLGIALFLAPRGVLLSERERAPSGRTVVGCRLEEASWLRERHADGPTMQRVRANGVAAFAAHLDVEANPRGALLTYDPRSLTLVDNMRANHRPPPGPHPHGLANWAGSV